MATVAYGGAEIEGEEAETLKDFEHFLGESIPYETTPYSFDFGFSVKDGHVVRLELNFVNLEALPDSLQNLRFIKSLGLEKNAFYDIPEVLLKLTSLEAISFSNNFLKTVPKSMSLLTNLKKLILDANEFETIPTPICSLPKLQSLSVAQNWLRVIPKEIGELHTLKELDLHHNKLISLPESVGRLDELTSVNVKRNKLESLPESLAGSNVQLLIIGGNPFKHFPSPVLKMRSGLALYIDPNQNHSFQSEIKLLREKEVKINIQNIWDIKFIAD